MKYPDGATLYEFHQNDLKFSIGGYILHLVCI